MRLVWVKGSFRCQTIAARTRGLILNTLPAKQEKDTGTQKMNQKVLFPDLRNGPRIFLPLFGNVS